MENEWPIATLDELKATSANAIAMGPFGSRIRTENFVPYGVPVIRGNNLSSERFHDDDFVYLTEQKADELRSANAFKLDIVVTHRGTLGQVGIIPPWAKYNRYVVSQSQMKLTVDRKRADPFFIFYFLRSPEGQHQLLSNSSQTGVPAIASPTKALKSIRIPCPSLPEQRAIARILGSLDDKIEANRRMNETLEAMARAIFKSWFVDFDPVRAKAAGREPAGMDAETAALFPDSFEEREGRMVPRGWEICALDDLMKLAYGKALKEENRVPGSVPVYGSNGQVGWHNEALAPGPGIIIGRKGNPGIVTWAPTDFFAIDTAFYVVPKTKCQSLYFLLYALSNQDLPSLAVDSAVPGLNRNFVYLNLQLVPPPDVLVVFDRLVKKLFEIVYQNDLESRTLEALRDALLGKLLTGEIRLNNAEQFLRV